MHLASPGGGPRALHSCLLLVLGLLASACNLSPYTLGGGDDDEPDDAGTGDGGVLDGGGNGDGSQIDAMPDACSPFPERCNTVDDDCDGMTDEGFDLTQDPSNCGACDNHCFQPNAAGTCGSSTCSYACLPGFVDTDDNLDNGCEYLCTPSNGSVEVCDEADNDCDEEVDEELGLDMDVDNCGSCGNRCLALHATATCSSSTCGFGACDAGFADNNPSIVGCEYECPVAITAETCNGIDDDCDNGLPTGGVDELPIAGLGDSCVDPGFGTIDGLGVCSGGACDTGRCAFGVQACSFGVEVCQGYTRPITEVCNDTIDDDCDGISDFDEPVFDMQNNPRHCGACAPCDGTAAQDDEIEFAVEGCVAGLCTVTTCLPGHVDLDGVVGNGCEYACAPSGPETCDGRDNDCDGDVDLDDDDLTPPADFCNNTGACSGLTGSVLVCAADACGGPVTWTCDYGPDVETDGCGDLPTQETACDNLDGDCDGATDETFPQLGDDCDDGGVGVCQGTGTLACDGLGTGLACIIDDPGQGACASNGDCLGGGTCNTVTGECSELCDDEDDDCDGIIDEDAPDDMVAVTPAVGATYYIYRWEASRPDASDGSFGFADHRSCSKPDALPWRSVTMTEAADACAAAGKRLCTETEWQRSCEGASGFTFPYGDTYQETACNGRDVDLDCTNPDTDVVAFTGRIFGDTNAGMAGCQVPLTRACVSPFGAIDLSGNLREWTGTRIGGGAAGTCPNGVCNTGETSSTCPADCPTAAGAGSYRVKGGAFDNIEEGLSCDFSFLAFDSDVSLPNLGFRCCSDTPDP